LKRIATSSRRLFRVAFKREVDSEIEYRVRVLKKSRLFETVPKRHLRDLAEVIHERSYDRDEYVYYEGDPGLGAFVVVEGRVRLRMSEDDGAVRELGDVGELEEFGLLSLLGDLRRAESSQAVTDTIVLGLFKPDLRAVERTNPRSGAVIMEALASALASTCADLEAQAREMRAERLAGEHADTRVRVREASGPS
jgi:CRP-like cAMP-binding protein